MRGETFLFNYCDGHNEILAILFIVKILLCLINACSTEMDFCGVLFLFKKISTEKVSIIYLLFIIIYLFFKAMVVPIFI